MNQESIRLDELRVGDCFHTLCTNRIGTLLEKDHFGHRVKWRDYLGPEKVHPNLLVEPWPREN